jgi:hypothetical protein
MPKHNKKVVLDDNSLRAFYKACGMSAQIIEGAIRQRYEEPLNFVAREKATAAAKVWPAPGSEDTELGVFMELEVGHGKTEVYAGVQA